MTKQEGNSFVHSQQNILKLFQNNIFERMRHRARAVASTPAGVCVIVRARKVFQCLSLSFVPMQLEDCRKFIWLKVKVFNSSVG